MRIAGTVQDSIVDGPGFRFTVFVQGCHHRCPGCHNPQTHDPGMGQEVSAEDLSAQLRSSPLTEGLSLSGGEPFDQPEACLALARAAHALGMDVWCWTGGIFEELQSRGTPAQKALLQELDVLVDGPFLLSERTLALPWRGSRSQRVIRVQESLARGELVLYQAQRI